MNQNVNEHNASSGAHIILPYYRTAPFFSRRKLEVLHRNMSIGNDHRYYAVSQQSAGCLPDRSRNEKLIESSTNLLEQFAGDNHSDLTPTS